MTDVSNEIKAYTQSQVWALLTGELGDVYWGEIVDLQVGLTKLPPAEATFLIRLGQGYTATQALGEAGLTGNTTRLKRAVVRKLTDIMNGDE